MSLKVVKFDTKMYLNFSNFRGRTSAGGDKPWSKNGDKCQMGGDWQNFRRMGGDPPSPPPGKKPCFKELFTIRLVAGLALSVWDVTLTLNCIRYPALPLVHNGGGFHGTPPEKTTFPPEFLNYLYTICIYTNHNHISGKKIKNMCTVSKWRPKNRFSFCIISISAKI